MNRYTLLVLSDSAPGILQRLTSIFTRRSINIESLTASESKMISTSRITVVFKAYNIETAKKILTPVKRIVEVIEAILKTDEELLFKEIAFFRISFSSQDEMKEIEKIVFENYGKIVMKNCKTLVIEKTGKESVIDNFHKILNKNFNINYFTRSGRIAMSWQTGDRIIGDQLIEV